MPFDLMAHAEGHSSDSLRSSSRRSSGAGLADNPFVRSDSLSGAERRPSLSTGNSAVQRYTGVPSANAVKVMTVPSPSPTSSVTSSNPSPASEEAPTAAHSWLAGALQAKAELPSPPRAPPAIAYPPVAAPTLAQKTVSAPAVAVTAVAVTPVSVTPPASLSPSESFTVSEDSIRVVALADGTEEEHDDDSQTLVHGGYEYRAFPSPCVPHGVSSYHGKPKFMLPAGFEVVSLDADFAAARDVVVRDHGWSALLLAVRAEPGSSAKTFTAFYTKNKSRGSEPGVEKGPTRWILSSGVISGREAFQVTDPGTRLLARRRLSAEALKQREVRGAAQARATARVAAARVAHEEGGARRLTMQPLGAARLPAADDAAAAGRQQLSLRKEVARLKAEAARLRAVRTALAAAVALLLVALWVAATIIADGAEAAPRRKGIPLWWQRLRRETTCVLASRPRDWGLV